MVQLLASGTDSCLHCSLLPALALRKNLNVKEALSNRRWMKGLHRIQSAKQLDQFIKLWEAIQGVQLTGNTDSIGWNLTSDKQYSACSAYNYQFNGRMKQPHLESAWHVHAEGKVKFFFWLYKTETRQLIV
jgi:hypothetical protein